MKLNLNKPLLTLDGKPASDAGGNNVTLGKELAIRLAQLSKGDAIKLFDWSRKLYGGDPLELDRSDYKTLKDTVENLDGITILFKAQLLECFNEK